MTLLFARDWELDIGCKSIGRFVARYATTRPLILLSLSIIKIWLLRVWVVSIAFWKNWVVSTWQCWMGFKVIIGSILAYELAGIALILMILCLSKLIEWAASWLKDKLSLYIITDLARVVVWWTELRLVRVILALGRWRLKNVAVPVYVLLIVWLLIVEWMHLFYR